MTVWFDHQDKIEQAIMHNNPCLRLISSEIQAFLFNEGFITRIVSVQSTLEPDTGQVTLASQIKVDKQTGCYLCLCMSQSIVNSIVQARAVTALNSEQSNELLCQILYCLNYKITRSLKKLGYRVKHGAAQAFLPNHEYCLALSCTTRFGPVIIAIVT